MCFRKLRSFASRRAVVATVLLAFALLSCIGAVARTHELQHWLEGAPVHGVHEHAQHADHGDAGHVDVLAELAHGLAHLLLCVGIAMAVLPLPALRLMRGADGLRIVRDMRRRRGLRPTGVFRPPIR